MDVSSRRYPHHRTPTCLEGGGISWSRPILERPKARGCVVIRRSCGLNVVGVPPSPMWRVVCPSPRGGKRACRARSVVVGRLGPYMGGRDAGAPAGRRLDRRGACVCRLVTRRHRPHNPRSNPEPTCPQTSVIASHAQVCSRRRVCVWPLISSTHGVMGLRIAAPPFAVSTLYNAHVRVLAWMGRHRAVCQSWSIVYQSRFIFLSLMRGLAAHWREAASLVLSLVNGARLLRRGLRGLV